MIACVEKTGQFQIIYIRANPGLVNNPLIKFMYTKLRSTNF